MEARRSPRTTHPDGGAQPPAGSGSVPWIRTRLRTGITGALAFGVLVTATAFLAAALPRSVDAYENGALRAALADARPQERRVDVTAEITRRSVTEGTGRVPSPADLAAAADAFRTAAGPLPLARDAAVHGVRNAEPAPLSDRWLPRPSRLNPEVTLRAQQGDLRSHATLTSGRMPAPRAGGTVEGVVTAATAEALHIKAGSVLHAYNGPTRQTPVRVTGIVEPRDPRAGYWNAEPDVRTAHLQAVPNRGDISWVWQFSVLIDSGARDALTEFGGGALAYWHHPLRAEGLTARQVPQLRRTLTSLTDGDAATVLRTLSPVPGPEVDGQALNSLLTGFGHERRSTVPLVMIAVVGVAAVAVIVLFLAGASAVAGRAAELRLLRARGAGLTGLGLRLLGETAAVAVPAAAAGTLLAVLLVSTERIFGSLLLGAAVAATASAALPLRAVLAHRRPGATGRDDVASARPSRRRTVAELTVAVIAVAALAANGRRGAGAEADLLGAAAPVLLATVAALVLLRLYPIPLRLLARPAARLTGAVPHLGLARAGRARAVTALPLLAVLVAFTLASFGGSVLASVAASRERAATAAVGGDARVRAFNVLPDGFAERVRQVPGVRDVAAVRNEPGLATDNFSTPPLTLVAVEPAAYARLVARTGPEGGPAFPRAALSRDVPGGDVPAVVSPGLARVIGARGRVTVETESGPTAIRAVAVRADTPAATGDYAVVSAKALARAHPGYRGTDLLAPTTLHISGAATDAGRLRALARRAGTALTVDVRADVLAGYGSGRLQSGAQQLYLAAVAAGAGYSSLALLLALVQGARGRRSVLSRLRFMGMTRRQTRGLVVIETLPQVLLGVTGGALTGLAAVPLLRDGVDLTALAFGAADGGRGPAGAAVVLTPDPLSLAGPAAALLVVACAVVASQAWWSGRRDVGEELRTVEET